MKITPINKKHFKFLFFATAIMVFILAIVNNDHIVLHTHHADKIKHITAFFMLSLLLNRSSSSIEKRLRNMIVLIFFGFLIEVVQYFIPSRDSDWMDVFADVVGIVLFQVSYSFLKALQYLIGRVKLKTKSL